MLDSETIEIDKKLIQVRWGHFRAAFWEITSCTVGPPKEKVAASTRRLHGRQSFRGGQGLKTHFV